MVINPIGEQVASAQELTTYYGVFFELTATFNDGYDFSEDTHEVRRFMERTYSRSVDTEKGEQAEKISELLKGIGVRDFSRYSAEKLLDVKSELIELLGE